MTDLVFPVIVLILLGLFFGHYWGRQSVEAEAVKRGVARYHHTTGAWEWTVPTIKESQKP